MGNNEMGEYVQGINANLVRDYLAGYRYQFGVNEITAY
jgi:hypothetical protein